MRIVLAPMGAHGDFYCMLALAKVLQSRGHWITFCAPEEYRAEVYGNDFRMVSSGLSYRQMLSGQAEVDSQKLLQVLVQDIATHFVSLRDALREADILVGSTLQLAGASLAAQFRVQYFYAVFTPILLEAEQLHALAVPFEKAAGLTGSLRLARRKKDWNRQLLAALNRERKMSGMSPVEDLYATLFRSGHRLIAIDSRLTTESDSPTQSVTGFWYSDAETNLDSDSGSDFATGPSPIYVGWFRQESDDAALFMRRTLEPLLQSGHSVLLSSEWKGIATELPERCRIIESREYDRWFSRLSGVIHCGHHRIVSQALRAAVPQIVIPYNLEQHDWSQRLEKEGLAIRCRPDPGPISEAAQKVTSETRYRNQCSKFAERIRQTNGATAAAEAIEKLAIQHA